MAAAGRPSLLRSLELHCHENYAAESALIGLNMMFILPPETLQGAGAAFGSVISSL